MANVILVAGLGYGDEGKGSIVDYLTRTRSAGLVVRYNGGAQAAHNVVDGFRHHTFAQFGSGTLAGAATFLSRYMLVNPGALINEAKHLEALGEHDIFERLIIEEGALITNPFQIAANRLKEIARAGGRHGSCGMGIGETMADSLAEPELALRVEDLAGAGGWRTLTQKLRWSQARKVEELREQAADLRGNRAAMREWAVLTDPNLARECAHRYNEFFELPWFMAGRSFLQSRLEDEPGAVIFEGAQGVLLDQDYGFQPYSTWTDTTFTNAYRLLEDYEGQITRLGVVRAYGTRHGAGPFPTEDPTLDLPDQHNGWGDWQQGFRVGHFDALTFDYALRAIGEVDALALTHLDCLSGPQRLCTAYELPDGTTVSRILVSSDPDDQEPRTRTVMTAQPKYNVLGVRALVNSIETAANVGPSVGIRSYGPEAKDKVETGGRRAQVRETAAAV